MIKYYCFKCKRILPFDTQNFCCFCGKKITAKNRVELPICPSNIKHGHCNDCLKKKAKKCDNCGKTNEVRYCVSYEHQCLCYDCRMNEATFASLNRSW